MKRMALNIKNIYSVFLLLCIYCRRERCGGKERKSGSTKQSGSLENPIKNPFLPTAHKKASTISHGFCVFWVIKVERFMVYSLYPFAILSLRFQFKLNC
jgi:hypothetical protein